MKTLTIIKSLIIITFFTFISCEKEPVQSFDQNVEKPQIEIVRNNSDNDRTGEDEEEEIIAGRIVDSSGVSLANIRIEIIKYQTNEVMDCDFTSTDGEFQFDVQPGAYLFRIFYKSSIGICTEAIEVVESVQIMIQL
ncbi:MAG: hypothetical protein GQ574_05795 [Crocinitomix sp.]|nr:hypothetical protein [Crocinitomix sp.]